MNSLQFITDPARYDNKISSHASSIELIRANEKGASETEMD